MPSRNSLKEYIKDGYYHVYNRGVEKRIIFEDDQDYKVFLKYLKEILSPPDPDSLKTTFTLGGQSYQALRVPLKNYFGLQGLSLDQGQSFKIVKKFLKNYSQEIDLIAYCLMPNHFHLLLKQRTKTSLEGFMRALMTRYSMYFNKRYDRVGSLFQGRYKAVLIENEAYLVHLSRYIHLNPAELHMDLMKAYSSYGEYVGIRNTPWIKKGFVLDLFSNKLSPEFKRMKDYKDFVEKYKVDSAALLGDLVLE